MEKEVRYLLGKILLVIFLVTFLIASIIYLNRRWEKIRDIRRQADAQSIIKALDFYNVQFGYYPANTDDDGDGWDKSNDETDRLFLENLHKSGLLPSLLFDPKNNEDYYYRYQKFNKGDFGCNRPFVIFQITNFETTGQNHGSGYCPDLDFTTLAPNGYTWMGIE